jgi:hypothetical protein
MIPKDRISPKSYFAASIFCILFSIIGLQQSAKAENWVGCVRNNKTLQRQTVVGARVFFLGKGPFQAKKTNIHPKYSLSPGYETGICQVSSKQLWEIQN